jgi:hypothetical protein
LSLAWWTFARKGTFDVRKVTSRLAVIVAVTIVAIIGWKTPTRADGPCPTSTLAFQTGFPITSAGLLCDSSGNVDVNVKVGGGGGTTTVLLPITLPTTTPTPQPMPINAFLGVAGADYSGNVNAWNVNSSGYGSVVFPSPQPVTFPSAQPVTAQLPFVLPTTTPTPQAFPATGSALAIGGEDYVSNTNSYKFMPSSIDENGRAATRVCDSVTSSTCAVVGTPANAASNGQSGLVTIAKQQVYNGSTWDNNTECITPVAVNISSATTTQIVALTASKKVYVCNYSLTVTGTSPTLTWEYGTGTACATGTTAISGAMAGGTTAAPIVLNSPPEATGYAFVTPSAQALCILSGGTTPSIQGWIMEAQF